LSTNYTTEKVQPFYLYKTYKQTSECQLGGLQKRPKAWENKTTLSTLTLLVSTHGWWLFMWRSDRVTA